LRITRHELTTSLQGLSLRRENIFYMDARRTLDIVDYWNLRALGRPVLPVPWQFADDPDLRSIAVQFLKQSQRPLPGNPEIELMGTVVCSRSMSTSQAQEFVVSLQRDTEPIKVSIQWWYPRLWNLQSAERNSELPDLIHHSEEEIEIPD